MSAFTDKLAAAEAAIRAADEESDRVHRSVVDPLARARAMRAAALKRTAAEAAREEAWAQATADEIAEYQRGEQAVRLGRSWAGSHADDWDGR